MRVADRRSDQQIARRLRVRARRANRILALGEICTTGLGSCGKSAAQRSQALTDETRVSRMVVHRTKREAARRFSNQGCATLQMLRLTIPLLLISGPCVGYVLQGPRALAGRLDAGLRAESLA
jgi:hypothetical protein